jgi:hypothetical protein
MRCLQDRQYRLLGLLDALAMFTNHLHHRAKVLRLRISWDLVASAKYVPAALHALLRASEGLSPGLFHCAPSEDHSAVVAPSSATTPP